MRILLLSYIICLVNSCDVFATVYLDEAYFVQATISKFNN
jgi:hypothetical protein